MDFPITELMDREACIQWLEKCFHPDGLKCPHCQAGVEQAIWFRKTKRSDLAIRRIRLGGEPTNGVGAACMTTIACPCVR